MDKLIGVFTGEHFAGGKNEATAWFTPPDDTLSFGRVHFIADADVDVDGIGSSHNDPYYQPDTSLHRAGKPLNADEDRYIVVPPLIRNFCVEVVLGCKARVTWKGKSLFAVVGDIGPSRKLGELSYKLAKDLGMNPSPINGGVDFCEVLYELWPGIPAPGYNLQHA